MGAEEKYFGERIAAGYDEHSAAMFDPAVVGPAVEMLAQLAGDGAALEFAIGTGRIGLPLAERGVRVVGIDNSEAMLTRLREKPGAERIEAVAGDMAATRVDGEFSLVYSGPSCAISSGSGSSASASAGLQMRISTSAPSPRPRTDSASKVPGTPSPSSQRGSA